MDPVHVQKQSMDSLEELCQKKHVVGQTCRGDVVLAIE